MIPPEDPALILTSEDFTLCEKSLISNCMMTNRLTALGGWFGLPRGVKVTKITSSTLGEQVNHLSRDGLYSPQLPFEESDPALGWEHTGPSWITTEVTTFERELSAGLLLSFPCLVCHTGHRQAWVECKCVECGGLWRCASQRRWAACYWCDPLRGSWSSIQIVLLVCGYKFDLSEWQELSHEQWLAATK